MLSCFGANAQVNFLSESSTKDLCWWFQLTENRIDSVFVSTARVSSSRKKVEIRFYIMVLLKITTWLGNLKRWRVWKKKCVVFVAEWSKRLAQQRRCWWKSSKTWFQFSNVEKVYRPILWKLIKLDLFFLTVVLPVWLLECVSVICVLVVVLKYIIAISKFVDACFWFPCSNIPFVCFKTFGVFIVHLLNFNCFLFFATNWTLTKNLFELTDCWPSLWPWNYVQFWLSNLIRIVSPFLGSLNAALYACMALSRPKSYGKESIWSLLTHHPAWWYENSTVLLQTSWRFPATGITLKKQILKYLGYSGFECRFFLDIP